MGKLGRLIFSFLLLLMAVGLIALLVTDSPTVSTILFGLMIAFSVALVVLFWIGAIYSVLKHPKLSDTERLCWLLVVLLLNVPGAFLYILFAKPDVDKPGEDRARVP